MRSIGDRACWILTLTAFDPEMAYQVRKLWVDQERNIPLREELYAKSGSLLKRTEMSNVVNINGRWFPKKDRFQGRTQGRGGH